MTRRILPLAICAAVLVLPGTIAAYDLGRPDARMLAGELVLRPAQSARPTMGLSLRGWDGGNWQAPPPTHITLHLFNVNTREYRDVVVSPEGVPHGDPAVVEEFFKCKRSGRTHEMAPQVVAMLADVARNWPDHTIEIVSGFRRRGIGARRSKHYTGHAIDFRVRGVRTSAVRDYLWDRYDSIGLGHYRSGGYLHIDYRPHEEKIGWNQYRRGTRYRYHPGWSK